MRDIRASLDDSAAVRRWRYFDFRRVSWAVNGIGSINVVSDQAVDYLLELVNSAPADTGIFIDFSRLGTLVEARSQLSILLESERKFTPPEQRALFLWGLSEKHCSTLSRFLLSSHVRAQSVKHPDGYITHSILYAGNGFNESEIYATDALALRRELLQEEEQKAQKIICDSFDSFGSEERKLFSTPLVTNGFFDPQKIIGTPLHFTRICLALEAKYRAQQSQIEATKTEKGCEQIRFLCASLRASPFVGALSLLCDVSFNIIGPGINSKVLSETVANPLTPRALYVFVADFIVGGTEIRIAESFAAHRNSHVSHCLCLGTLLSPKVYNTRAKSVSPLVDLSKFDRLRIRLPKESDIQKTEEP